LGITGCAGAEGAWDLRGGKGRKGSTVAASFAQAALSSSDNPRGGLTAR
jgi:hypothetical protein